MDKLWNRFRDISGATEDLHEEEFGTIIMG